MKHLAILDYGAGNLYSIRRAFEKLDVTVSVTTDSNIIKEADGFILPGVGAFQDALPAVNKVFPAIRVLIENTKPILGICLGMQLFFTESMEDGNHKGLDLIQGTVNRLPITVKVPHIGWNTLENIVDTPLTNGLSTGNYVYFVHSYVPQPTDPKVVVATSSHGGNFPAIINTGNIWGTQFHPEKSGDVGLIILRNFVTLL